MPAFCPQGRQRNYKHVEAWRSPLGSFKGPTLYFNEGEKGERLAFPFRMADGRDGEKLEGALRFRLLECTADDRWRVETAMACLEERLQLVATLSGECSQIVAILVALLRRLQGRCLRPPGASVD